MRQAQALKIMLDGHSVFLTGAPGAGKTYVLNEYIRKATWQGRTVAVTASTGIAATHIGGSTIHSWSGLGVRDFLTDKDLAIMSNNSKLVRRYIATDVLVIDEVSMLHGMRLDMLNQVAKLLRESDEPFGGMQVILVGDLFQLPPITRGSNSIDFVHTSESWNELNPKICYISEQHRQQGGGLLDVLEAMRSGDLTSDHGDILRARLRLEVPEGLAVTRLYAHNIDVDSINSRHLLAIADDAHTYTMSHKGGEKKVEQLKKSVLAPETLELKIGAEVMFVANNFPAGYVNGSRGIIVDFEDDLPLVRLHANRKLIKVESNSWALTEDERKVAEVAQLPLRLAWAITIHKSQGMSLDAAEIDLSKSFTPGMGYVALSRVRSIDGVYLAGVNSVALTMHDDIYSFDELLKKLSQELADTTEDYAETVDEQGDKAEEPIDDELFENLRSWRLKRAQRDKVAPFIIAHDSLLKTLSVKKPKNRKKLLAIKGMGPKKAETYGDEILEVIAGKAKV
jgi:ATP-dependent DNA helicase PIF1